MRIPKTPKAERKSPMVEEGRPRPPLNLMSDVAGDFEIGVERKTGKTCMKAALWRGKRATERRVYSTSRVQIDFEGIPEFPAAPLQGVR